jgi:hypothetical protein
VLLDDFVLTVPVFSPVCSLCAHFQGEPGVRRCAVFDEIPPSIWLGKNKHLRPYPGDKGLQFEPFPAKGAYEH